MADQLPITNFPGQFEDLPPDTPVQVPRGGGYWVNGKWYPDEPEPEGERPPDFTTQNVPVTPELAPPSEPSPERPPVVTNPFAVLAAPQAATARALASLTERPGDLGAAARAAVSGVSTDITRPSVADITSPSKELAKRGVELGPGSALMLDIGADPTNLLGGGGNPILDAAHLAGGLYGGGKVLGAMALGTAPELLSSLRGLTSRLITKLLPMIPETRGIPAQSLLSKALSGLVSKEELAYTGLADWLKQQGAKPVTRADFQRVFEDQGIPMYERWYGNAPEHDAAINDLTGATSDIEYHERDLSRPTRYIGGQDRPDTYGLDRRDAIVALPSDASREAISDALRRADPRLDTVDPSVLSNFTDTAQEYLRARDRAGSAQAVINRYGKKNPQVVWGDSYATKGGTNRREFTLGLRSLKPDESPFRMTDVHRYEDPNPLAHVRMADFTTDPILDDAGTVIEPGKRVLLIDEAQSDVHQTAGRVHEAVVTKILVKHGQDEKAVKALPLGARERLAKQLATPEELADIEKKGYGEIITSDYDQYMDRNGFGIRDRESIPDIPFKGSDWQSLVMKRVLNYAAEHGYDEVAWTTGLQQSDRYNHALRSITKLEMTPEGEVNVYLHGNTYADRTFGPFRNEREAAASEIGPDAAARLFAVPVPEQKWSYEIFDPEGQRITTRMFATEEEADAARQADKQIYHPAERPPRDPDWYSLSDADQTQAYEHYKESLRNNPEVMAAMQQQRDDWLHVEIARATNREISRAVGRKRVAYKLADLRAQPNLDTWRTFLADAPRPDVLTGQLPLTRGLTRPQANIASAPTVGEAITDAAKRRFGIEIDPATLDLRTKPGTYGSGWQPTPLPEIVPNALRHPDGSRLSLQNEEIVRQIADEAFAGVQQRNTELEDYIERTVGSKSPEVAAIKNEKAQEIRGGPEWDERLQSNLTGHAYSTWWDKSRSQRLQYAREAGVPGAQLPDRTRPLAPNTGEVGDVEAPNMSRVLDLTENPLTINSKGMVQQYDVTMPDIGKGLGKQHGVVPRRIQIQVGRHEGPFRIQTDTGKTGYGADFTRHTIVDRNGNPVTDQNGYRLKQHKGYAPEANVHGEMTIDEARAAAERVLKSAEEDRTVWSMAITPKFREEAKKGFPLLSLVPPAAIGTYVWLKNGQRVRVTDVHDDGSFDAEAAPLPRRRVPRVTQ